MLQKAYEEHGNVRSAAKALGIGAATFVRKRQKYEEKLPVFQKWNKPKMRSKSGTLVKILTSNGSIDKMTK